MKINGIITAILMIALLAMSGFAIYEPDMDGLVDAAMDADGDVDVMAYAAAAGVDAENQEALYAGNVTVKGQNGEKIKVDAEGNVDIKGANGSRLQVGADGNVNMKDAQGNQLKVNGGNVMIKGQDFNVKVNGNMVSMKNMFQNQEIRIDDFEEDIGPIEITPGRIQVGGLDINNTENKLFLKVKSGENVEVNVNQNRVMLKDSNFEIESEGLSIKEDEIYVDDMKIMMPSAAVAYGLENRDVRNLSLKKEGQELKYEMKAESKQKFLGMFSVTVEEDIEISAETGEKIKISGPWWNFLAFE